MKGILELEKLTVPPTLGQKVIWRLETHLITADEEAGDNDTISLKLAQELYKEKSLYKIICKYLTEGDSITKELPLSQKDYQYAMYHRLMHEGNQLEIEEDFYMVDDTEEAIRKQPIDRETQILSSSTAVYYIKILGDDIKWYTIWREFKATGEQYDKEFYTWIKKHYYAPQNKK